MGIRSAFCNYRVANPRYKKRIVYLAVWGDDIISAHSTASAAKKAVERKMKYYFGVKKVSWSDYVAEYFGGSPVLRGFYHPEVDWEPLGKGDPRFSVKYFEVLPPSKQEETRYDYEE